MDAATGAAISQAEFLEWERRQPEKYEFGGVQPIPMTGVKLGHARLVLKLSTILRIHLPADFEAFASDVKVLIPGGQVRYPDVLVAHAGGDPELDHIDPIVVIELLSPSTQMTDLKVKPSEYRAAPSIQVYVILSPGRPEDTIIYRKATGWTATTVDRDLDLPEIGLAIPMAKLFS